MALTALKVQDLTDQGFMGLFDDHRDLWEAKARGAYDYANDVVTPTGQPVRPDDVLPMLIAALELADEFRDFLEEKRLRQKYWKSHFAELILDTFWADLEEDQNGQQQGN